MYKEVAKWETLCCTLGVEWIIVMGVLNLRKTNEDGLSELQTYH